MGVISLQASFTADIGGVRYSSDPESESTLISLEDDLVDDRRFTLAQNDIVTLWLASSSPCPEFAFLWIESDVEVILEFTVDVNAGVGTELITATLSPGVPFVLGSDQAYANYTTNFAGGTLDVIDRIRCKNLEEDSASVRIFVAQ